MRTATQFLSVIALLSLVGCRSSDDGWRELFNGRDLKGWKVNEHPETFSVVDGNIMAFGPRAHLFFDEPDNEFRNFELELEVMTHAKANSGIFIGTEYQEEGWPSKGFEVQINNSHPGGGDFVEYKKTGSLYGVRNIYKPLARDSTWFTLLIRVEGQQITIKVNDQITSVDHRFTAERPFAAGTIALQGHDPESKVLFRSIRIRELENVQANAEAAGDDDPALGRLASYQARNFPISDMDVTTADSTIDQLTNVIYSSGVNAGVITRSNQPAPDFLTRYPVWSGRKVSDLDLDIPAVRDVLPTVDYVSGKVDISGWAQVTGADEFMETYVKLTEQMLKRGLIDIWDDAGRLPDEFAEDASTLWTAERMNRLLDAARDNGVAIEINCAAKTPIMPFVRLAKEKGCRFVCGDTGIENGFPDVDYFLDAVDSAALTYNDVYTPPYR